MSVSQSKRGATYRVRVYAGRDPETGRKLYREARAKTKEEAREIEARLKTAIADGTDLDAKRVTVAEYLERWIESKDKRLKSRSIEGYRLIIRKHIVPIIGSVQLSKLRPLHVEKVLFSVREKGRSETTALHVHRCLFAALRQAVRWQLIARNVAEAVEAPRAERHRVEAMQPQDAHRVLSAVAGTDLELPTMLALGTGMRRGEVLGLRWADVDLDRGQARISQQMQRGGFDTPKTHRSTRPVSLPPFVVEALRQHKAEQNTRRLIAGEGWTDLDLVVDRGDGKAMHPDTLSKGFARVASREGFCITFHGLRHGYATLMLSSGVSLKVTQGLLGHSTFSITADLYTHVAEQADADAANRLESLLFPANS